MSDPKLWLMQALSNCWAEALAAHVFETMRRLLSPSASGDAQVQPPRWSCPPSMFPSARLKSSSSVAGGKLSVQPAGASPASSVAPLLAVSTLVPLGAKEEIALSMSSRQASFGSSVRQADSPPISDSISASESCESHTPPIEIVAHEPCRRRWPVSCEGHSRRCVEGRASARLTHRRGVAVEPTGRVPPIAVDAALHCARALRYRQEQPAVRLPDARVACKGVVRRVPDEQLTARVSCCCETCRRCSLLR